MFELLYSIGKDILTGIARLVRRPPAEELLKHAQSVKAECERKIGDSEPTDAPEIIVVNIGALHKYPTFDLSEPGRDPGWKLELKGVDHAGIEVFVGVNFATPADKPKEWCIHFDEVPNGRKVYLVGHIPFDNIRAIDWSGDEFSTSPKFFCRFNRHGDPYDDHRVYELKQPDTHPYFDSIGHFIAFNRRPWHQRLRIKRMINRAQQMAAARIRSV